MATRDVVIFGAGDLARVASEYLEEDGGCRVVAFTAHGKYVESP